MTEEYFRDLSINMPIPAVASEIDDAQAPGIDDISEELYISEEQLATLRRYREFPVQRDGNTVAWQEEFYNMTMNDAPHPIRRSRVRRARVGRLIVRPQFTYEKCVRSITEKEGQCATADQCAICFDTHVLGDSMVTQCNHQFGKECYENWMTASSSNGTCPSCRTFCPRIDIFEVEVVVVS